MFCCTLFTKDAFCFVMMLEFLLSMPSKVLILNKVAENQQSGISGKAITPVIKIMIKEPLYDQVHHLSSCGGAKTNKQTNKSL